MSEQVETRELTPNDVAKFLSVGFLGGGMVHFLKDEEDTVLGVAIESVKESLVFVVTTREEGEGVALGFVSSEELHGPTPQHD